MEIRKLLVCFQKHLAKQLALYNHICHLIARCFSIRHHSIFLAIECMVDRWGHFPILYVNPYLTKITAYLHWYFLVN
jgi:hypothetical protein